MSNQEVPEQLRLEEEVKLLEEALAEAHKQLVEDIEEMHTSSSTFNYETSERSERFSMGDQSFLEEEANLVGEAMIAARKQLEEEAMEEMELFVDREEQRLSREGAKSPPEPEPLAVSIPSLQQSAVIGIPLQNQLLSPSHRNTTRDVDEDDDAKTTADNDEFFSVRRLTSMFEPKQVQALSNASRPPPPSRSLSITPKDRVLAKNALSRIENGAEQRTSPPAMDAKVKENSLNSETVKKSASLSIKQGLALFEGSLLSAPTGDKSPLNTKTRNDATDSNRENAPSHTCLGEHESNFANETNSIDSIPPALPEKQPFAHPVSSIGKETLSRDSLGKEPPQYDAESSAMREPKQGIDFKASSSMVKARTMPGSHHRGVNTNSNDSETMNKSASLSIKQGLALFERTPPRAPPASKKGFIERAKGKQESLPQPGTASSTSNMKRESGTSSQQYLDGNTNDSVGKAILNEEMTSTPITERSCSVRRSEEVALARQVFTGKSCTENRPNQPKSASSGIKSSDLISAAKQEAITEQSLSVGLPSPPPRKSSRLKREESTANQHYQEQVQPEGPNLPQLDSNDQRPIQTVDTSKNMDQLPSALRLSHMQFTPIRQKQTLSFSGTKYQRQKTNEDVDTRFSKLSGSEYGPLAKNDVSKACVVKTQNNSIEDDIMQCRRDLMIGLKNYLRNNNLVIDGTNGPDTRNPEDETINLNVSTIIMSNSNATNQSMSSTSNEEGRAHSEVFPVKVGTNGDNSLLGELSIPQENGVPRSRNNSPDQNYFSAVKVAPGDSLLPVHHDDSQDKERHRYGEAFATKLNTCLRRFCELIVFLAAAAILTAKKGWEKTMACLGPRLVVLKDHSLVFFNVCREKLSSIADSSVNSLQGRIIPSINHCIHETREDLGTMKDWAPDAWNTVLNWMAETKRGLLISYLSITISMITEIYPPSPHINCFIATMMVLFQVYHPNESKGHVMLIMVVLISVCVDIDWLVSTYLPLPLDKEDDSFEFRMEQEESLTRIFAWYGLLINIGLKILCLNACLKSSLQGRKIRSKIWERGNAFCPPFMKRLPEDLNEATRARVITLAWIEMICSILFFSYFFVVELDGVAAINFQDGVRPMLSVRGTLILKGTSGTFVFLSLAHHLRMKEFFSQFGCSFETGTRGRETAMPSVGKSLKCIISTKAIDFAMGVLVWMGWVEAQKENGYDAPKEVSTMMDLIFCTMIVSTILSPLLLVVIWYYIKMVDSPSNQNNEPPAHIRRREAFLENTPASTRAARPLRRFAPYSAKRSGRKAANRTINSQNSRRSKVRANAIEGIGDFSYRSPTRDTRDYDLNDVHTSQSLFAERLQSVSPPSPNPISRTLFQTPPQRPVYSSPGLDINVTCTPAEFQMEWQSLGGGGEKISYSMERPKSLSDCHNFFQYRRFYIIASGVVGEETKLYLIAQRKMKHPPPLSNPRSSLRKTTLTRCLLEITSDSRTLEMSVEIRCRQREQVPLFLSALDLDQFCGA